MPSVFGVGDQLGLKTSKDKTMLGKLLHTAKGMLDEACFGRQDWLGEAEGARKAS